MHLTKIKKGNIMELKQLPRNKRLSLKMVDKGVSGALLAYNAGICESRLSRIRNGLIQPTGKEKEKIASLLDSRVTELFGE